jgi:hypothetical protein
VRERPLARRTKSGEPATFSLGICFGAISGNATPYLNSSLVAVDLIPVHSFSRNSGSILGGRSLGAATG